ncbi:hypothetical protein [Rhodopirellula bahusiensis]|uniref:hypothetical protein n=1 Tax=Rhodopirellula bahusiensis TaxID=2014065 RepID=UPI003265D116
MDPDTALEELLNAVEEERWNDAADHAEDLSDWLGRGGFAPKTEIHFDRHRSITLPACLSKTFCYAVIDHVRMEQARQSRTTAHQVQPSPLP